LIVSGGGWSSCGPAVNFIDDEAGKPLGINAHIGRRPIAAFRYSDGDLEMLQWTTLTDGIRFGMLIHTDAEREYACDRKSHVDRSMSHSIKRLPTNGLLST
jgi:hypothetical protein